MEKNKETLEQLKQIVSDIRHAITLYNSLNPDNKLVLTEDNDKENVIDVSDVYVCTYDKCHVGFFQKFDYYSTPSSDAPANYTAGIVFKGINSKYTSIITTHLGFSSLYRIEKQGFRLSCDKDKNIFVSNCQINKTMSFDDMRLIMKKEGELGTYKIGESTSDEMQKVLEYAFNYYKLNKKIKSKKFNK